MVKRGVCALDLNGPVCIVLFEKDSLDIIERMFYNRGLPFAAGA